MSELEDKLSAILKDPNMMEQIMGMARTLSANQEEPERTTISATQHNTPQFDPSVLKALSGFTSQIGIDQNQDSLLKALHPYLSQSRIQKLEKAMQAAKMASAASVFLNSGGGRLLGLR